VINEPVGLATTASSWYWVAGLAMFWILSFPLLTRSGRKFTEVMMSLLGLSWMAFGFGILIRFILLTIDAEEFASPSLHLVEVAAEAVDLAMLTASLFWLTFVVGAVLVQVLLPLPRPLFTLMRQADRWTTDFVFPAIVACTGFTLAGYLLPLPGSLITPIAVLSSMWVIPATFVWTGHFSGQRTRPWWFLAIVFLPGVTRLVLSPYRELILVMVLVVVASAIHAGRKLNPFVMAPLAVVLLVVSTVLVGTYRSILWSPEPIADTSQLLSVPTALERFGWRQNLQRFHVFDSLLLTVDLVPDVFPHADRNPLLEGVTNGLVPRFLNPAKNQSNQAMRFQTTIWSYYNDPNLEREDATAAIAPSMPGSLYEAGGLRDVAIGGFLWAVLLAAVTRVVAAHRTPAAVGLYVLCAVQAMAGLERDYALAVSTLLQTLLMFFGLCALAQLADRRGELMITPHPAKHAP
jgi:hypothetical protein